MDMNCPKRGYRSSSRVSRLLMPADWGGHVPAQGTTGPYGWVWHPNTQHPVETSHNSQTAGQAHNPHPCSISISQGNKARRLTNFGGQSHCRMSKATHGTPADGPES